MKNNKFRSALNQELKHVRVDEKLKRRIIAAAEEEKRRRQRKIMLRAISGLAAALVVMLGATGILLAQRPEVPDIQNQPLSQGQGTYTPAPKINSAETPATTAEPAVVCIEDPESTPEPTDEPIMVWATDGGKFYHTEEDCSGMINALRMTLFEAMEMGKGACRTCNAYIYNPGNTTAPPEVNILSVPELIDEEQRYDAPATPEPTYTLAPEEYTNEEFVLVWATQQGTYYHADAHCSGMMNAGQITLATAIQWQKKACPVCQPPSVESSDEGFSFGANTVLKNLAVTSYGGTALLAEYGFEQSLALIEKPDVLDKWYSEEADMNTFSMHEALEGRVSPEDRKLLEEEYFLNFEAGFMQNDVVLISEDIATQNMKAVDPLPEAAEYHFRVADDTSNGIILYDFANDSPWTADHITMTSHEKLYSWYFDGKNIYSDSQWLGIADTLIAPVQDGGAMMRFFNILDVNGNGVSAKLWKMDDMKILILEVEDSTVIDWKNTGFMDENGEAIAPFMMLDPAMHKGNIAGWIFKGDNLPDSGDSLEIALADGMKKGFAYRILESGAQTGAEEAAMVWTTKDGKFYHAEENCSGMEDAFSVDLLTAAFKGKQPCQVCNPPAYDAEYDGSGMVFSFEREESEAAAGESNLQLAARHYEGKDGDVILLGGDYEYGYEYVANLADSASPDWIETPVVRENFNAHALETLSGRLEKQHIHDWFRYQIDDPEMGILWDEVNMSAKGVDTQIAGVGNPVASGMEYRFVDMNDPGYKIALYELNEAYYPSEMEVNLLTHKVGRYYDGENMGEYEHPVVFTLTGGNDAGNGIKDYYLQPSDIIDGINRQTVEVSPVPSGKVSIFEDTLEAGGARIQIKILRMEDCMAIMLQPGEDAALAENTGIVSAGFETLQSYMEMDPVWHPEWKGWLFQGEIPEGGDKLVISLENGETREFDFGTLI